MAIIELRESIGNTDVLMDTDADNVKIVQKRINLKEGSYQRNMLSMDLFFDDPPHVIGGSKPTQFIGTITFMVTPTPVILTGETLLLTPKRALDACNTNVLYKSILYQTDDSAPFSINYNITRFPQDFIASNANYPFFHDQLYLTMVFRAYSSDTFPIGIRYNASIALTYNEKKVSAVRSALGVISERFNAMVATNKLVGNILERPLTNAGTFIPSYEWGGIRPELMVSGQNLTQYWLRQDGQEPETMQTTGSLRSAARQARQMVANPDAFGTPNTPIGNVPDWFAEFLPKGVEAGAVRDQYPPRVTQDNPAIAGLGNILMV